MPLPAFYRNVATLALIAAFAAMCAYGTGPMGFDLHGKPIPELAGPGVRVVVLFFAASDCPISNRYVPEVARLSREFSSQGVRFWWVYPNVGDTAAVVEQHNREFSISGYTLLDPKQTVTAMAHASTTSEAAVFLVNGGRLREVYDGRIDDRYISIGQERPRPEHHDLEVAIAAALAGKPVPQPGGRPVGCSIVFLQK